MSYTIRPEEHQLREARQVVEGVMESCKYILEKDQMLELNLAASPSSASIGHGAHGLTANAETAQIYFRPEVKSWKNDLEKVVYGAYGKSWFYEKTAPSGLLWRELLAESFSLMFIDQNTAGERPDAVPAEFEEEWGELKAVLKLQVSEQTVEEFSWQLKWFIGNSILEDKEIEEFPDLRKSDVEEAGEELFR